MCICVPASSKWCLWTQRSHAGAVENSVPAVQMNVITSAILKSLRPSSPAGSELTQFSCAGTDSSLPTLPGLFVDGHGIVPLPFLELAAPRLTRLCERAPDAASKSWQLNSDKFRFTNPEWDAGLQKCVQRVKKELSCDKVL
jgi:hypothetical protein